MFQRFSANNYVIGYDDFVAGVSATLPSYSVYTGGQMGDHGYGPVTMEKNFRVSWYTRSYTLLLSKFQKESNCGIKRVT